MGFLWVTFVTVDSYCFGRKGRQLVMGLCRGHFFP